MGKPTEVTVTAESVTVTPRDSSEYSSQCPTPEQQEEPKASKEQERYHIFTHRQKWNLVIIIGIAGLFSGLSSNIYFPAEKQISRDLGVSLSLVSLTITSYLIIQGISPVFWGALADSIGRRPIYIASFAVYIVSNIFLSYSPNYAVLLVFRGLQSAGSASTVSIGNGVIQDITPLAERAGFISFYQAIRNFSIAVGPVLGGALSNDLGFRSIFIFLFAISVVVLVLIVVILPETLRSIAGNGSYRLSGVYQPLIRYCTKEPEYMENHPGWDRPKISIHTFIEPLKLLIEKDIILQLVFGGVIYTIWSMVTATTTGLLQESFKLNELFIGLCFLSNGAGTIIGSAIIGKLMTIDFKSAEQQYKEKNQLPNDYVIPAKNLPMDFSIERARLRHLPWITVLFIVSVGLYGFTVEPSTDLIMKEGWLAVPLLLQFLIAATSNAVFAMNQTMVSDLCPGKGASATAINNLVRCELGALGVGVVQTIIDQFGPSWTFLALGVFTLLCTPIAVVSWIHGARWRVARMERQASS
ncbi:MFS general substrate transporter [Astrocystis sublimbata]|nr:MFS general substrate transporter [Astrocystis sublimbata]